MKKYISELIGKRVISSEGEKIGDIDNIVADTRSGALAHVLVAPSDDIDPRLFKTDSEGRLVLPFTSVKSVKDFVVMELK